ncbi:MAG TPA: hypothetical protein VHD56_04680 [Tepidisphaeraceae bacterium]|nr:hypothetical protein [Tepidisphaeraceae bacterium]
MQQIATKCHNQKNDVKPIARISIGQHGLSKGLRQPVVHLLQLQSSFDPTTLMKNNFAAIAF